MDLQDRRKTRRMATMKHGDTVACVCGPCNYSDYTRSTPVPTPFDHQLVYNRTSYEANHAS